MRSPSIVCVLVASTMIACAGGPTLPPPPGRPLAAATFAVEFTPAGPKRYAPTTVSEVKRYKTIAHWPGEPDWESDAEVPSRPYVDVGRLHFPIAWHYLEEGVSSCPAQEGLVVEQVRAVGGHAVLLCEVFERARGIIMNPDTGAPSTVSYRALTLDVIRYTD